MIDKMLVSVMAGFLTVVLGMQLLLCGMPFFRRMEFDATCHKYALLMDRAGGMDDRLRSELISELKDKGFTVERVAGTSSASYGSSLNLVVEAGFPFYRFSSRLVLEEVSLSVIHHASFVCRVLKIVAAVP